MPELKIDINIAKERIFKKHGEKISLIEYSGANSSAKFKCNICLHSWDTICNSVWRSSGCPNCWKIKKEANGPHNKLKIEDVEKFIESKGCKLISTEYFGGKQDLKILFECGHEHMMGFETFKRGQRCPCGAIERFKNTVESKTRTKIITALDSVGFKLISFEDNVASWDGMFTFTCNLGHTETRSIRAFMRNKFCKTCTIIRASESRRGSLGGNWQGGKVGMRWFLRKATVKWKKESIKNCNYKCVITGERFKDVHHLYPAHLIFQECLDDLGISKVEKMSEYTQEQILLLWDKLIEKHEKYPLGVCLTRNIHKLFHQIYGNKNFTPENFYEFQDKIKKGEIAIPPSPNK